jgi:hypothetical protein
VNRTMRLPRELQLGDVIVGGSKSRDKGEVIKSIQHYACGGRGTHINGKDCYHWSIPVQIYS